MSTSARIDELRSKFDENPRRYFAPLANEYRKAGDLDLAIALCREHLPKQPGHMSGHIVFGQALFEHGELAEAQMVFESALELDPENLIALRHLGDIARSRGDALSAKRWYERVLDADPRNDDIASLLGALTERMTPSVPQSPYGAPNAPTDYAPPIEPAAVDEDPFDSADSPQWHTPAFLTPLGSPLVSPTPSPPQEAPDLLDLDSMVESSGIESAADDAIAFDATMLADAREDFSNDSGVDVSDADSADDVALEIPDFLATSFEPEVETGVESTNDVMLDLESTNDTTTVLESVDSITDDDNVVAVALDAFATNDPFEVGDAENADLSTPSSVSFSGLDSQDALIEVHSFSESVAEPVTPEPAFDDADEFEEGLVAQQWPDTTVLSSRAFTPARARTPIESAVVDEAFGREVEPSEAQPEPEPIFSASDEAELPAELEDAFAVEPEAGAELGAYVEEDDENVVERITTAEFEAVVMVDEDPPVWSAEAPWSAVAEDEHEADELEEIQPAESESNPAFVTETMAELLVAQGFVDRAVTVYEELVGRRPYDEVLTSRLSELRAMLVAENAPVRSATPALTATPISMPLVAPMSRPTARQVFAALAAVRVARRTPAFGAVTVSSPTPADGLASLFGELPVISDDMAARSLAQAFGNQDTMQPGPSLFSPASDEERERTPMSAAPEMDASSSAPSFSFDRFFPDPANAQSSTRDSAEGAERGGAVIGSDAGNPASAPQPSAGDDLAQFASWLKGLSNS